MLSTLAPKSFAYHLLGLFSFLWLSGVCNVQGTPTAVPAIIQTVCQGGDPIPLTIPFVAGASTSFQWFYKEGLVSAPVGTESNTSWSRLLENDATYNPPDGATSNRTYACQRIVAPGMAIWEEQIFKVKVLPAFTLGSITPRTFEVISPANPALISFAAAPAGATKFSYQWFSKAGTQFAPSGSNTSGWTSIPGANTPSFQPPSGIIASITFACFTTPTGSLTCGNAGWAAGQVQIKIIPPVIDYGFLSTNYPVFCARAAFYTYRFARLPTGAPKFQYRWFQKDGRQPEPTGTSTQGWTEIAGQTGDGLTSITINPITKKITLACFVTPSNAIGQWASGSTGLTVHPPFSLGRISAGNQVLNPPATPSLISFFPEPEGDFGIKFMWFQRDGIQPAPTGANPSVEGWTEIPGVDFPTFQPPAGLAVSRSYACFVSSRGLGITACGDPGWAASVRQITVVQPQPLSYGTLAAGNQSLRSPADAAPITFSIIPSGALSFSFQWFSRLGVFAPPTGTNTDGWLAEPNATAITFDPPAGRTSTRTYVCLVTPSTGSSGFAIGARVVVVNL